MIYHTVDLYKNEGRHQCRHSISISERAFSQNGTGESRSLLKNIAILQKRHLLRGLSARIKAGPRSLCSAIFCQDGVVEFPDLRDRQIKIWGIAHGSSFRIVSLYLAKIRLIARRKSLSDAKVVEALTSTGSLFERRKNFSRRVTVLNLFPERQSFNPKILSAGRLESPFIAAVQKAV